MTPSARIPEDPSSDAAQLLVRLGLALLAIGVPCASVFSRRLIFSLMPVGGMVILIGVTLAPSRHSLRQFRTALASPTGLTALFLIGWSGLSLVWTPFVANAAQGFFKTSATALLAGCVAAFLPDRTKTSNLYLLPIGTAAAALATLVVALIGPLSLRGPTIDASALDRSAVSLVVLLWPALGALAVRERWVSVVALAIAVAVAAIAVPTPLALAAFAAGAVTFLFAMFNPIRVSRILAGIFAVAFLAAPAFPLVVASVLPAHAADGWPAPMFVWADITKTDSLRLITGHGVDAAARSITVGFLPAATPRGILFQVWYELGIVGACASAALVGRAFVGAGRTAGTIAPFLLAGLVCGLTLAIAGLSLAQLWWVTLLSVVGITFAVVAKGQYRTVRPAAQVVNRAPPQRAI